MIGIDYNEIEQLFVTTIKKNRSFKSVEPYAGQFDRPFSSPDDYSPNNTPYAFVTVKNERNVSQRSGDLNVVGVEFEVVVFVGSKTNSTEQAKKDVFPLLTEVRTALHSSEFESHGNRFIILWDQNTEEFLVPNHTVWSQTYKIKATIT